MPASVWGMMDVSGRLGYDSRRRAASRTQCSGAVVDGRTSVGSHGGEAVGCLQVAVRRRAPPWTEFYPQGVPAYKLSQVSGYAWYGDDSPHLADERVISEQARPANTVKVRCGVGRFPRIRPSVFSWLTRISLSTGSPAGRCSDRGIGPGSMYSQAYVSAGGSSASVAPCDRVD